ncbi:MAG: nucleotidyltransferase [Clostridiales bacterium GWC2_40_7]|nr:MAG: nucleotidyltransferase [Clostridiales bacterium GWC2_40_7]
MTKIEITQMIKNRIVENINPKSIVLFGSVSKGNDREDSDIDLLVIWDEKKELPNIKRRIIIRKIIGMIESSLDVLTCTTEELSKALEDKDSFTSRIVSEGELIYGGFN